LGKIDLIHVYLYCIIMGVRYLNKFLYDHCPRGMQYITFEQLRGSTIVVDISIYMYRFKAIDELLSLIQSMLQDFITYNIHGIFIFDGKPKQNKKDELIFRKEQKEKAWQQYKKLVDDNSTNIQQLQLLKKQCTKINIVDVANVKELMDKLGAKYTVAPYEADEVCAKLSVENKIYCMSDDMDMLVYGCNRVLRNVNFTTKTATLYKLDDILDYLQLSYDDFKRLCIVSGTDYYKSNKNIFNIYKRYQNSNYTNLQEWLKLHLTVNFELIETICHDFDISSTKYEYLNGIIHTLK
jgi:5'-3' exonuclease